MLPKKQTTIPKPVHLPFFPRQVFFFFSFLLKLSRHLPQPNGLASHLTEEMGATKDKYHKCP